MSLLTPGEEVLNMIRTNGQYVLLVQGPNFCEQYLFVQGKKSFKHPTCPYCKQFNLCVSNFTDSYCIFCHRRFIVICVDKDGSCNFLDKNRNKK